MMSPGGPGWNDPPSLSYETHSQTTSRRNLLTKRVGLPDLKVPENSAVSESNRGTAPPTGPAPAPSPSSESIPSSTNKQFSLHEELTPSASDVTASVKATPVTIFNPIGEENAIKDEDATFKSEEENVDPDSMDINFIKELKNMAEKCENGNVISKQVCQTILKKIDILEKQISEQKLPKIIEEKMEKLTKLLILKKYDEAWKLHLSLVCDHSSNVMQWMVGVKRLMSELKKL